MRRFDTVSSEGYHYRIDFDKYDSDLNRARHCRRLAKMDFDSGLLTAEEFEEENKKRKKLQKIMIMIKIMVMMKQSVYV